MCDRCTAQGLAALEAIANGEEIPNVPHTPEMETADFSLPFPVYVQVSDEGYAMIATTEAGWTAIQGFLESIGKPFH